MKKVTPPLQLSPEQNVIEAALEAWSAYNLIRNGQDGIQFEDAMLRMFAALEILRWSKPELLAKES